MSLLSTAIGLAIKFGPDIEALAVMVHNRMPDSPNKEKLDTVLGMLASVCEEFRTVSPEQAKAVSIVVKLARFAGVLPAKPAA